MEDEADRLALSGRLKHDDSFFAKFGEAEGKKQRLKTELHDDYLRFKLIDEQRFKNRFAHKKLLDMDTNISMKTADQFTEINAKANENEQKKARKMGRNVSINQTNENTELIDKKLFDLEQSIEQIRHKKSVCIPSTSENKSTYEDELLQRLQLMQEAEGRINRIDDEYNRIKESIVESEVRSASDMKRNNHKSTSVVESLKPPSIKHCIQHNYLKELENQIRDSLERCQIQQDHDNVVEECFESLQEQVKHSHLSGQISTLNDSHNAHYGGLKQPDRPVETVLMPLSENLGQINISEKNSNPVSNIRDVNDTNMHVKLKKAQYAQDLRYQIEESRLKKEMEKRKEEEYDKKIEERCRENKPVVTLNNVDLKDVKYNKNDENHARGGHGIFGSPLTAEQKVNLQKYKEDLANQIAEKHRFLEEERLREMDRERREEERLRNQQLKIQAEYEEEKKRLQTKRDHLENPLIPAKPKVNTQIYNAPCEKDGNKHTFDEMPSQKKSKRIKGYNKPKKHIYSNTTNTSELLIIMEDAKDYTDGPIKLKRKQNVKNNDTHIILQQLRSMRNKLEQEKARVEEVIVTRRTKANAQSATVGQIKPLPRVGKRGTQLFGIFNHGRQYEIEQTRQFVNNPIDKRDSDWLSEALWDERLLQLDQQQQACLSIQNDYLRELKQFPAPISDNSIDSDKMKLPNVVPREADLTSERSIDIKNIANKNEERNRKLETIQLLNMIGRDPELILERFLTKHDAAFDADVPMM